MNRKTFLNRTVAATMGALLLASGAAVTAAPPSKGQKARAAPLPAGTQRPSTEVLLSVGQGQLVNLPQNVTSVWTSNPGAADVYVNSPRQIYLFGKDFGEATVFATTASGQVAYATNVRVSQNITSLDGMLRLAMPDANIKVTTVGQTAILTGTVASPEDSAQAEQLIRTVLNPGVDTSNPSALLKIVPLNRLKTATPLQVNLQVKIAEVSRALLKEVGTNLLTRDTTGGFQFNIAQGRSFGNGGIANADLSGLPRLDASSLYGLPAGSLSLPFDPRTGQFITQGATVADFSQLGKGVGTTSLGFLGRLFGIDVASALDLAENDGLVTTLAQPNLTALSGETASFLAGGEFPVPISQERGTITIFYKQYGVSLAFTPTVLTDGRISMRVRPEVSELSSEGAIILNGFNVPGLVTRRAETTIELGSGQSFMIGGLLRNTHTNSIDKAPALGDVPVLGALFRSSRFRRQESELVIVVTPYLVKPVSANELKLPTDGYMAATDVERLLLGQSFSGKTGVDRPKPSMAPPTTVRPGLTTGMAQPPAKSGKTAAASVGPGFSK